MGSNPTVGTPSFIDEQATWKTPLTDEQTPLADDRLRAYATNYVLQRYHLTDLAEARQKLTPAQFEGVQREIDAVQAQIIAQAAARTTPRKPDVPGIDTPYGRILPVTGLLLVAIWIVFILENLYPGGTSGDVFDVFGAITPNTLTNGQYWRLVAACFLHANVVHIVSNSLGLVWLGSMAERVYGPLRFLGIYLAAGVGGNLLVVLTGNSGIGASGAILGLLGALIAGFWRNRGVVDVVAGRQLVSSLAVMLVLNLAIGFIPGISLEGHLGGAITGAVLALLIPFCSPREPRTYAVAVNVVSAVLIVASVALAATYPGAH